MNLSFPFRIQLFWSRLLLNIVIIYFRIILLSVFLKYSDSSSFSFFAIYACIYFFKMGRSSSTLYVGNLPGDIREREVEDLFYKVVIYNFEGISLSLCFRFAPI